MPLTRQLTTRRVGTDVGERTSRSLFIQTDKFEVQSESPTLTIPVLPIPNEMREDLTPLFRPTVVEPEISRDVPTIPNPQPNVEDQDMLSVVQLLTQMVPVQQQQIGEFMSARSSTSESFRIQDFLILSHLIFTSSPNKDP